MLNVIIKKKLKSAERVVVVCLEKSDTPEKISSPQVVLRAQVVSNGIKTLLVSGTIKFL